MTPTSSTYRYDDRMPWTHQDDLRKAREQRGLTQRDAADLTTARDNALAGLPAAISAVPNADIWTLILNPMRARSWPCDTYYSSGTYWSVDFASYC